MAQLSAAGLLSPGAQVTAEALQGHEEREVPYFKRKMGRVNNHREYSGEKNMYQRDRLIALGILAKSP